MPCTDNSQNISKVDFFKACGKGDIAIVEAFLQNQQAGVDDLFLVRKTVNGKTQEWTCTPLMVACMLGHIKIVEKLLADARFDINKKIENNGKTLLHLACESGHLAVIERLLADPRIDVNQATNSGETPFFIACEKGHLRVVKRLLVDPRTDTNKTENHGMTPFYIACYKGNLEIIQLFLQKLLMQKPALLAQPLVDVHTEVVSTFGSATIKPTLENNINWHIAGKELRINFAEILKKSAGQTVRNIMAEKCFFLVVFYCDYLLKFSEKIKKETRQFFDITAKLPPELQHLVCKTLMRANHIWSAKAFEPIYQQLAECVRGNETNVSKR
jgi:hypothetical protein